MAILNINSYTVLRLVKLCSSYKSRIKLRLICFGNKVIYSVKCMLYLLNV